MFGFIRYFLEASEREAVQGELRRLRAQVLWYESRYGKIPSEVDVLEFRSQLLDEADRAYFQDEMDKGAIPGVCQWNALGGIKDEGSFRLGADAVVFRGREADLSLPYREVVRYRVAPGLLTIRLRDRRVYRFDWDRLASLGLREEDVQEKLAHLGFRHRKSPDRAA